MTLVFPEKLRSDSIRLRQFLATDSGWITTACDRPEMARFVPVLPSPYTEVHARGFIEYAHEAWRSGTSAPFAIESAEHEPLGAIEVHLNRDDPGRGGVGYWLRPEARGRGAATEALKLGSRWAFEALGIERLSLVTDPENVASQRVAERAGYQREGLLRAWLPTTSGRRDCTMFSLLRTDLSM